jgi:hypothetical protein
MTSQGSGGVNIWQHLSAEFDFIMMNRYKNLWSPLLGMVSIFHPRLNIVEPNFTQWKEIRILPYPRDHPFVLEDLLALEDLLVLEGSIVFFGDRDPWSCLGFKNRPGFLCSRHFEGPLGGLKATVCRLNAFNGRRTEINALC